VSFKNISLDDAGLRFLSDESKGNMSLPPCSPEFISQ
jgi:hypothetical protein